MTERRSGGDELVGPEPVEADPPGTGTTEPTDAAGALAREVYWAGEGTARLPTDVGSLRERLDAFSHQLRVEQRQLVPMGETLLGSTSGWRRRIKQVVWYLTRFSTMRYDRLLADLAEMNGELARRVLETEEEVARLRAGLDRDRGGSS